MKDLSPEGFAHLREELSAIVGQLAEHGKSGGHLKGKETSELREKANDLRDRCLQYKNMMVEGAMSPVPIASDHRLAPEEFEKVVNNLMSAVNGDFRPVLYHMAPPDIQDRPLQDARKMAIEEATCEDSHPTEEAPEPESMAEDVEGDERSAATPEESGPQHLSATIQVEGDNQSLQDFLKKVLPMLKDTDASL